MPFMMNCSEVTIKQYNQKNTVTTKYFKEPSTAGSKSYDEPIIIDAQVAMNKSSKRKYTVHGVTKQADGYLVIEKSELEEKNIILKEGDLIVSINEQTVNFKIDAVNIDSPLIVSGLDYSEFTLVEVFFVDNTKRVGGVE